MRLFGARDRLVHFYHAVISGRDCYGDRKYFFP